jgi:hypothetical protein
MDQQIVQQVGQQAGNEPRRWGRIIIRTIIIILVLGILLAFGRQALGFVWWTDDQAVNDQDLQLTAVDIPEEENSYFDLIKLSEIAGDQGKKAEIIIDVPGKIDIEKYLESYDWEIEVIEGLVEKNKAALKVFSDAAQKPKFQSMTTAIPAAINSNMPLVGMNAWRRVSKINAINAIHLARIGEGETALEEAMKSVKVGYAIENSKNASLITYLIGLSIRRTGLETIKFLMEKKLVPATASEKYIDEFLKYQPNNIDSFKFEYLVMKMNLENLKNGQDTDFEKPGIMFKNNFYFQLKKTINLAAENYRQLIKNFTKPCGEAVLSTNEVPYFGWQSYLHENFIGKMLTDMGKSALNSVRDKKCEADNLLVVTNELFKTNTATGTASVTASGWLDSDNDGLTDYEESTIYKSDPNKADSDDDGYQDGKEVDGGFNPIGAGKLIVEQTVYFDAIEKTILDIERARVSCNFDSYFKYLYFPGTQAQKDAILAATGLFKNFEDFKMAYARERSQISAKVESIKVLERHALGERYVKYKYLIYFADETGKTYSYDEMPEIYFIKVVDNWLIDFNKLSENELAHAKLKSRDAKRISDVKQIQTALELYFNDERKYPDAIYPKIASTEYPYLSSTPPYQKSEGAICDGREQYGYKKGEDGKTFAIDYCLESDTGSIKAGENVANELKITQNPIKDSEAFPSDKLFKRCAGETAPVKSNDEIRYSDMKNIQIALELNYNDTGRYPDTIISGQPISGPNGVIYMRTMPSNPKPAGDSCVANPEYKYEQKNSGESYELIYCLEENYKDAKKGVNIIAR